MVGSLTLPAPSELPPGHLFGAKIPGGGQEPHTPSPLQSICDQRACGMSVIFSAHTGLLKGNQRFMEEGGGSRLCGHTGTSWSPRPAQAQPSFPLSS